MYGYSVIEMHESQLIDYNGVYTVYTAELDIKEKDYSILDDQERQVSKSLKLYNNNVILRFL